MSVTAQDILRLLEGRHSKDVFVPECKDGPTHYSQHRRLDAWVMARSWAHPCVTGYEIKVGRQDFLRDTKWTDYLSMCNELYFVCQSGLIAVEEVPEGAGLLWVAKTGTRLFTKRKAPYRDIEIPDSVWRYILMCRTKITRERFDDEPNDCWRQWLAEKAEKRDLGLAVSKGIRETVDAVNAENRKLRGQIESADEVRAWLKKNGLSLDGYSPRWELERQKTELAEAIPSRLDYAIKSLRSELDRLDKNLGIVRMAEEDDAA